MASKFEPGSEIAGKYLFVKEIGSGGTGTVYLVQDPDLNRPVALKLLNFASTDNLSRFEREARALSLLNHPNIVQVYKFGRLADQSPYLALEYLEGETLADLIARKGKLACSLAVKIGIEISKALDYAHGQKIIHRDLKPENILVYQNQTDGAAAPGLKLLDFGLCKQELGAAATLTETGFLIGTVHYMSPEQCLGKEIDWRSDIYSFGALFYEMITGWTPFTGNSPGEILLKQMNEPVKKISKLSPSSKLPAELDDLIGKCMVKEREERVQSFAEIIDMLRALETLNSNASFNQEEAKEKLSRSESHRWKIPWKVLRLLVLSSILLLTIAGAILVGSDSGRAIIATQIQASFPAPEARKILKESLGKLLDSSVGSSAKEIVAATLSSGIYRRWPVLEQEKLIGDYIDVYERRGQDREALDLSLRAYKITLDSVFKKEQAGNTPPQEELVFLNSICKSLLERKSTADWKQIFNVVEKGKQATTRSPKLIWYWPYVLRVEALRRQESGFGRDRLHDLAEQSAITADLAGRSLDRKLLDKYSDLGLRIARANSLLSIEFDLHISRGNYFVKTGDLNEARKELELAEASSKTLLLSSGRTHKLEFLKDSLETGRPLSKAEFSERHQPEQRAENPFLHMLK